MIKRFGNIVEQVVKSNEEFKDMVNNQVELELNVDEEEMVGMLARSMKVTVKQGGKRFLK